MATITLTAAQVRSAFADTVAAVQHGRGRVAISRNGKKVAALVSLKDLRALEAVEDRLDVEAARRALADPERLPWEKVKADLGIKPPKKKPPQRGTRRRTG